LANDGNNGDNYQLMGHCYLERETIRQYNQRKQAGSKDQKKKRYPPNVFYFIFLI
jgi:hypothetical protein